MGLFATAYGEIWEPLYYGIEISSMVCNYIIYVITVILCGRMIWSMSQKYLLINKITGNIITESADYEKIASEYRKATMEVNQEANDAHNNIYNPYFDSDSDEGDIDFDDLDDDDDFDAETYRIRIHILPKFINKIWKKTGSPVWGILIQAIISAIICFISTNYHLWTEFLEFMYLFSFLLIIFSFLVLKYTEYDMIREYEIPGKKLGAWICSILCVISIMIIGLYLVKEKWDMFIIAIALNIAFIIYYIIWRICGCFVRRTKKIIRAKSDQLSRHKSKRLQADTTKEFEHSISDTIPLL